MGLDMYLEKIHRDVVGYMDVDIEELDKTSELYKKLHPYIKEQGKICTWESLFEEVGYWRKANAIHKWFVDNVQNGADDCGKYRVTVDQLKQLVKACKEVLKDHSKAGELLPPQGGFFFGSTEVDDWYFEDLKSTVKQLTPVIKECSSDNFDVTLYYQSSW